jgi:resuscitation-promoting factor RpfB
MLIGATGCAPGAERVSFAAAGERAAASTEPSPTPTPVVVESDVTATEPVPFAASTVEDANLPSGQQQLTTAGVDGERTLTYRVRTVDGVEVSRELVSDVITREPVGQVTSVGTYVAPPPPPPPAATSGCDSNYAEACVPIASDVDCAWGSGNGPAYFDGVARVVGADVYDLDRDGDGYACER